MIEGRVGCSGSGKEDLFHAVIRAPGGWSFYYLHCVVSEIPLSFKKGGMKEYMGVLYQGLVLKWYISLCQIPLVRLCGYVPLTTHVQGEFGPVNTEQLVPSNGSKIIDGSMSL